MMKSSPEKIQFISDACFNHLIAEPELLGHFMAESGTSPEELRQGDPQSLAAGLIDFFAQNEPALLSMCANARITTDEFMRAYYSLNEHDG